MSRGGQGYEYEALIAPSGIRNENEADECLPFAPSIPATRDQVGALRSRVNPNLVYCDRCEIGRSHPSHKSVGPPAGGIVFPSIRYPPFSLLFLFGLHTMEFILYYYTPSAAAAGIFVVLFGISTILHFYQLMRTRSWFMIPFFIGGICQSPFSRNKKEYPNLRSPQWKPSDMSDVCSRRCKAPTTARAPMPCRAP